MVYDIVTSLMKSWSLAIHFPGKKWHQQDPKLLEFVPVSVSILIVTDHGESFQKRIYHPNLKSFRCFNMKLAWSRLEGLQQQTKHHSLSSCAPCSLAKQCQSKCRVDRWPSAYLVCRTVPVIANMTNKRPVRKSRKFNFLWLPLKVSHH